MKFINKIGQVWKDHDLRRNILFVLGMLAIFRLTAQVPVPGVDVQALREFFASNQFLGLLNIFSGGSMENFSIVALGIGPYITASIILQLLTMIVPALEEIAKDGEAGHRRINQYTRVLTVPLAYLQGFGIIKIINQSPQSVLKDLSFFDFFTTLTVLAAGTMFLMWLGELITEKKVGNGISLLIFAGIVSGIPSAVARTITVFNPAQMINLITFLIIALITIAGVVIITEAQRNIPISYAKRVRGIRMYGGMDTHLPLRVNQAGMIPIIFAIAIILFPPLIARFFLNANSAFIVRAAQSVVDLFQNQIFYGAIYFVFVFGFTYFYTAVVFHPQQIAENLQKQGGFVPGIRPGSQTADYLGKVSNRIILAGAVSLGLVAILPLIIQPLTGVTTMMISGASLLIVVSVVLETVRQIDSQLVMRDYEGL